MVIKWQENGDKMAIKWQNGEKMATNGTKWR